MVRKCPVCREVLLTQRVGDLERCDPCGHYVDPEGAIVEAREGRIRTALAEAATRPLLVEDLERLLARGRTEPADLRELCERYRERVRKGLDAVKLPDTVELVRVEPERSGYRDASRPGRTEVRFEKPTKARSESTKAWAGCASMAAGFAAVFSLCIATSSPGFAGRAMLVFFVALAALVVVLSFVARSGRPVRQLVLEDGDSELEMHLVGRSGDRVTRVPMDQARLHARFSADDRPRTHLRLRGPGLDVLLLVVMGSEKHGRAVAARLEDALRLSGPTPPRRTPY